MDIKAWRPLAGILALVIGVYLVGLWTAPPGVLVGDVVTACEQPHYGWYWWFSCPDRAPRTAELASVALALAVVGWIVWLVVRRVARFLTAAK